MIADHFRMLWRYSCWANDRILARAGEVGEADYFAVADGLSFGSLHATLVHMLLADIVWVARFLNTLPPEAIKDARAAVRLAESEIPTFEALATLWRSEEQKQASFFQALTDAQVASSLRYVTQYGEANEQPMSQLLAHYFNHGAQFRSEAAVRLTHLGHSPGDLDLIIYLREGGT